MAKINTKYKHFKGGKYKVILIVRSSSDMKEMVVYQQLYESNDFPMGTFWIRSLDEFDGCKKVNGVKIKRFEIIG